MMHYTVYFGYPVVDVGFDCLAARSGNVLIGLSATRRNLESGATHKPHCEVIAELGIDI